MFGLGMSEIIFLAILALVVVGPKELPQLARTLGRFLNELKRSSNMLSDELKQQVKLDRLDLDAAIDRPHQVRREEQRQAEEPLNEHPAENESVSQDENQEDSSENKEKS